MPVASFPCLEHGDTIELTFALPQGGEVTYRLLVDSGFTGQSSFVLPQTASHLAHALAPTAETAGALHGVQNRVVVVYRIAALAIETAAIAILADTAGLALPTGVEGMAGLRFLRQFRRWGAERGDAGDWQFFLEVN
jgi:predicted aspartyl protease